MLIGSEGTLGVVTECAIQCHPMPRDRQVCLLGMNEYSQIVKCLERAKISFSDSLSAIEYMDWHSARYALEYLKQDNPFPNTKYGYYMLMEVTTGDHVDSQENLQMKLIDFLEECEGLYEDGIISESE